MQLVAGIGGGGMTTVVSILMSDIVTLRERGVWQGVINIVYATGAGIGAPLGMQLYHFVADTLLTLSRWCSCRLHRMAMVGKVRIVQKESC